MATTARGEEEEEEDGFGSLWVQRQEAAPVRQREDCGAQLRRLPGTDVKRREGGRILLCRRRQTARARLEGERHDPCCGRRDDHMHAALNSSTVAHLHLWSHPPASSHVSSLRTVSFVLSICLDENFAFSFLDSFLILIFVSAQGLLFLN